MQKDVVLRRWIPRSAERWAAAAVRLLMEVAVIRKRIMTRITTRMRTNMMRTIAPPPVMRTTEKKKTTMRTMTKITTRTKRIMAIAPIPAMRRRKKKKVNMAAGVVVAAGKKIMTMNGAAPGALREDAALPAAEALPAVVVLPVAAVLPEEDSPLWIATRNAASPARADAPTMKKEATMDMTKEEAAVAEAAVAAAAVPVPHPEAARVPAPAPPAAAVQVLPEEGEARHAIQEDSSPAVADVLAMAAATLDNRPEQIGSDDPICFITTY
jgi:hypothetical protein